jgi:hypothetical protein
MTKVWRLYGDGQDLHLAVQGETPLEAKDKALLLFPRFFFLGIKKLEMRQDPKAEERRPYAGYRRNATEGSEAPREWSALRY